MGIRCESDFPVGSDDTVELRKTGPRESVSLDNLEQAIVRNGNYYCCQLMRKRRPKDVDTESPVKTRENITYLINTTMCLSHTPKTIACVCINAACKVYNYKIQACTEKPNWFSCVDPSLTLELLERVDPPVVLLTPWPLFRLGMLGTCLGHKKFGSPRIWRVKKTIKNTRERITAKRVMRSISALMRVKTEKEKLNSLKWLRTRNAITKKIDSIDVINDFAMI
ncbi:hypothetical protein TNCV_4491291 [Trichonephila clavipes]|nr:hypothetical protein TNCV_4491291 [Trichonephila clavipes]